MSTHHHDGHDHDDHDHGHGHGHDHSAAAGGKPDIGPENSRYELMAKAMRELLIEKGVLSAEEVRSMIEKLESPGEHLGARIVARAWTDPDYKARLLDNAKAACTELGIAATEAQIIVVENTPTLHNVIVCTLCSCYPRSILGQPPAWYVSLDYRSRTIRDPRTVLAEFGLSIAPAVAVRVHDSTADMRYLVLPMRPEGTDGYDEQQLIACVNRDSLIGTALARAPMAA
ncbi:nitrile hydratase subunit alpha [Lacisediminimonas sp.]|uniref:nitrile hydratase subunit alpha n=1 Tax=Lacisediminimonas sp. TaxID=3060582 RepID=UPI0027156424|nr:nitrile hydratase subunit alpha [Lacisediminimonas sp.]MDO8301406.1 nitrile hydratase subunit alpha [Lacisediminimonas sp.]MDO9218517.1 nitrile hydratase subunit alpha [Lacisediminimonas sp.]